MNCFALFEHPRAARILSLAIAGFVVTAMAGCGASDKGAVRGKVIFEGQPVSGGSITFAPIRSPGNESAVGSGKPATGRVGADGLFVLSTDDDADGASIGRHHVVYAPPSGETETPDPTTPRSPYEGLAPRETEVEVKGGRNEFTVELIRPR